MRHLRDGHTEAESLHIGQGEGQEAKKSDDVALRYEIVWGWKMVEIG